MTIMMTRPKQASYWRIQDLLKILPEPNRINCIKILEDNLALLVRAQGSSHNHQAWPGGYIDHITEVMNIAIVLYKALDPNRPLPFALGQALLVLFLHDVEKPWAYYINGNGSLAHNPELVLKPNRRIFRERKLAEYGIVLTAEEKNAMFYIEGEGVDYSSDRRVMGELAAFCHMCDVWSARGWWSYPREEADFWIGAQRHQSKKEVNR